MKKNGFTLIELLAVISIISILFILFIPKISSAFDKAKETGIKIDFRDYDVAFKMILETNKGEITETLINKELPKTLQFKNSKAHNKRNEYILFISDNKQISVLSELNNKIFELAVARTKEEVKSVTTGFDKNIESSFEGIDLIIDTKYLKTNNEEFEFENYEEGISIVKYIGNKKNVLVPAEFEGKKIIKIGAESFMNKQIKTISLPYTIREIDDYAFYQNNIENIVLPFELKELGEHSFSYNNLNKIKIPNKVERIGASSFESNVLNEVILSEHLTILENQAFYNNKIKNIKLIGRIENIMFATFYKNDIKSVQFLTSVKNIGEKAFADNNIKEVLFNDELETIGKFAFDNNKIENLILPINVRFVGTNSFTNNSIISFNTILEDWVFEEGVFDLGVKVNAIQK